MIYLLIYVKYIKFLEKENIEIYRATIFSVQSIRCDDTNEANLVCIILKMAIFLFFYI